jgi:SAM-dependent MidA family methyltransferase
MQDRLPQPSADELAHSARLVEALRAEIAASGPMPFARYMERCLYTPGLGYYSAGTTKFGAAGDFVTAPELGELFARCVVQAVAPALTSLGEGADFLELGGGSGAFAETALRAMHEAGALPARYLILEPSADLRERQRARLAAALPAEVAARVHWLDQPPAEPWRGVLFANEVVDALPVARFAIHDGAVQEEYVTLDADGRLVREDRPASSEVEGAVRALEQALGEPFADGYRSELLPQLPAWIAAIAGTLQAGLMLLVDYGFARREYYAPARRDGTLMAHYRHRAHADPLYLPGLNDLTASVDFTALADAGVQAGFALVNYLPQSAFLMAAGLPQAFEAAFAAAPDEAARYRLAQQVKRLTLPEQMGERFQAMLFVRGLDPLPLPEDLRSERPAARL